jgi:hypothetical protein
MESSGGRRPRRSGRTGTRWSDHAFARPGFAAPGVPGDLTPGADLGLRRRALARAHGGPPSHLRAHACAVAGGGAVVSALPERRGHPTGHPGRRAARIAAPRPCPVPSRAGAERALDALIEKTGADDVRALRGLAAVERLYGAGLRAENSRAEPRPARRSRLLCACSERKPRTGGAGERTRAGRVAALLERDRKRTPETPRPLWETSRASGSPRAP